MTRKEHLKHTVNGGPTCKGGRVGAALSGEHITVKYSVFSALRPELQCERCRSSKLFAFLERQTAKALAAQHFNPVAVANFITAKGYICQVEGDRVIVQDPVYVTRGAAAGRFLEFQAVTLRSDAEARRFLSDRS